MKTLKGWREAKVDLGHYLQVGDEVDDGIYEEMLNCMPPRTHKIDFMQVGEPSNHINGRATYCTFVRPDRHWIYKGDCFGGEKP